MGRSKARLTIGGTTLLLRACAALRPFTRHLVIAGDDGRPLDVSGAVQLDDVAGVRGPLAGILAAQRYDSAADWLVVGCDMPDFDRKALEWLIEVHDPAAGATLGILPGRTKPEPLLAIYAARSAAALRQAASDGELALHRALARIHPHVVAVPEHLTGQWRNINTPEEWARFEAERANAR